MALLKSITLSGMNNMNILITGAKGFIGSNLCVRVRELNDISVRTFTRENSFDEL